MTTLEIIEYVNDEPKDEYEKALWLATGWKLKKVVKGEIIIDLTVDEIIAALKAREKFKKRRGKKFRLSRRNIVKFYARKFNDIKENVVNEEQREKLLDELFMKLIQSYEVGQFSRATFFRLQTAYRKAKTRK